MEAFAGWQWLGRRDDDKGREQAEAWACSVGMGASSMHKGQASGALLTRATRSQISLAAELHLREVRPHEGPPLLPPEGRL